MTYNTERRGKILSFLSKDCNRAFTITEICDAILTDNKGKSTVYRIISELLESGMLKKIADEKTRLVKYQYLGKKNCTEHLHIMCKVCGKLVHLDREVSKGITSIISAHSSFSIDYSDILKGKCELCASKVV